MARPNKPHWHPAGRCFRCKIGGRVVYFPASIGQFDRPMVAGIPKAAWDWLEEYKRGLARRVVDPHRLTVWAVCQAYLQWAELERDQGRMTTGNLKGHMTHLARFWEFEPPPGHSDRRVYGDRLAAELDPSDLEAFANAMVAAEFSPHYVSNLCKSVQACFNWAATPVKGRDPVRLVAANPVKGYRPPKPPKAPERYIDPARVRAFFGWCWRRARRSRGKVQRRFDLVFVRMLWFLYLTGARPGEACGARWDKVDWRSGILVLEEWKNRRKTGRVREIHLTPPVVRLLRRIERLPGRNPEWVFSHTLGRGQAGEAASTEGTPWNSDALAQKVRKWRQVAKAEWEAAKAAGEPVGELPIVVEGAGRFVAYLLRHSHISEGLHAGLSNAEIADLVGTSAQMIEDTYGHIQREHSARRARELAEKLRPVTGAQ